MKAELPQWAPGLPPQSDMDLQQNAFQSLSKKASFSLLFCAL